MRSPYLRKSAFDNFSYDVMAGLGGDSNRVDGVKQRFSVDGFFHVEVWRKGQMILEENFNGISIVGLNNMLGVNFHADTQLTGWYIFPISSTSYSALAPGDTMASHSGWLESVAYSETTRPQWTAGVPSAGSITNPTQVTLTISADNTSLVGLGVCSNSTKSATTGNLWATGPFSSTQTLNSGDLLKITYTVNLTPTN